MSPRREVEFPWGDGTVVSRPTLLKVSQIEAKFGAAAKFVDRLGDREKSFTGEVLPALAIMLRGCDGVPKTEAMIMDEAFAQGASQYIVPMINWIVAGLTVDTPSEPTPQGN
jgi:hypothetical protein